MHFRFIVLAMIFVAGLGLLSGITGNVISESCCDGELCESQNRCVLQQPSAVNDRLGVVIVLFSILIALGEVYLMRTKPKEQIDRVI